MPNILLDVNTVNGYKERIAELEAELDQCLSVHAAYSNRVESERASQDALLAEIDVLTGQGQLTASKLSKKIIENAALKESNTKLRDALKGVVVAEAKGNYIYAIAIARETLSEDV